jgi:hypothetical protein
MFGVVKIKIPSLYCDIFPPAKMILVGSFFWNCKIMTLHLVQVSSVSNKSMDTDGENLGVSGRYWCDSCSTK